VGVPRDLIQGVTVQFIVKNTATANASGVVIAAGQLVVAAGGVSEQVLRVAKDS